ncbi:universal stress protein [Gaetbulibacter sp. M235]|uniref:universal stress protein n=1 Tax=Gaetbulibacter sp. M235 TaxID=3126510 RepID=UPI00374E6417
MKNILLPTDFSENSWNAIQYAIHFFDTKACNFHILHVDRLSYLVTGDIPYAATDSVVEEVYTKPAKIKLRQTLKHISEQFPHHGKHRFYTYTDYNFFTDSVKKMVDEKNIDCIVMGTKGASGLNKYIIGSSASDVITRINCTTLAIPENAKFIKPKEIAFPTDFLMHYDEKILQFIKGVLKKFNVSLKILHIGKKETELTEEQNKNKKSLADYFNNVDHEFHFLTNKNIEDGIQCFIESRNINMLFLVAKNLNYFQHILFHSKVEDLSYHLEIPFFVLHE